MIITSANPVEMLPPSLLFAIWYFELKESGGGGGLLQNLTAKGGAY